MAAALGFLERDPARTAAALGARHAELQRGYAELLRPASVALAEESLSEGRVLDLVRLSTEFHPGYLRFAEHVFGNLLSAYWTAARANRAAKKFVLKNAVEEFREGELGVLCSGYDDRLRNAVAHGQIVFSGFGIRYGLGPQEPRSALDFLADLETLVRTCNALSIALILFLSRRGAWRAKNLPLPPSLLALVAAAAIERTGLEYLGSIESETPLAGKQLHVAYRTEFLSRIVNLHDSARLAYALVDAGADSYDRFLFEVHQGRPTPGLIPISGKRLKAVIEQHASVDRLGEVFQDVALLWHTESRVSQRLKTLRQIGRTRFALLRDSIVYEWQKAGLAKAMDRYRVRRVEKVTAGWYGGVKVTTVLVSPTDGDDRSILRAIIQDVVSKFKYTLVPLGSSGLKASLLWHHLPRYVIVSVYRVDGSLRWLSSGGWMGGNLLAVGERTFGFRPAPRDVDDAQEIWKKIRIRYEIDQAAIAQVAAQVWALAEDAQRRAKDRDDADE